MSVTPCASIVVDAVTKTFTTCAQPFEALALHPA